MIVGLLMPESEHFSANSRMKLKNNNHHKYVKWNPTSRILLSSLLNQFPSLKSNNPHFSATWIRSVALLYLLCQWMTCTFWLHTDLRISHQEKDRKWNKKTLLRIGWRSSFYEGLTRIQETMMISFLFLRWMTLEQLANHNSVSKNRNYWFGTGLWYHTPY